MKYRSLTTILPSVCACAMLAACSPDEAALEARSTSEHSQVQSQSGRQTDTAGPLDEPANAYIARRKPDRELQPGEAEAEAVGAIAQCVVCHGPNGAGSEKLGVPRIGGMAEWYLARQLKYFQAGLRGDNKDDRYGIQMRAIVLPLSGKSMEDLAAHVATMEPPPAPPITSGDASRGAELYVPCTACHGADGRGSPELNTPGLVAQSGSYLVRQLEHFRTGLRGTHPDDLFGQQMVPIVESSLTSRQDAVDVATYIGTLRNGSGAESPSE